MVTTIQQALRPFFLTYFIMGLSVYPTRPTSKISWITCFSILYFLIIWLAYAYLYYYTVTLITWKKLYGTTISLITAVINMLTTIVSTIMSFYHQKKLEVCIKRLVTVNDTLEQLGTPTAYRRMHIYSKIILTGWIAYYIIGNSYDSLWLLKTELDITWVLIIPYILNHCWLVNTFVDSILIFFLWYIGNRFDKVNEHMQCLLENEKYVANYKWKKPVISFHRNNVWTGNYKQTLWTLMHLRLELCRIAREINLIFGTQMTFEILSYITNITTICFGINILLIKYRGAISISHWFAISCSILTHIMRLFLINHICECIMVKAKKIDKMFYEVTNIRYSDIWKEIYQFDLQAIQHPLNFTGMGLFYFGNNLLRKLCTTILMYVIIMIQMKIHLF